MRNMGSYPALLEQDFPISNHNLQFVACTGKKVNHLINVQLPRIDRTQKLVTVSIGGNDISFSKILTACLFKPNPYEGDDCDSVIERVTQEKLQTGEFARLLDSAYAAITNHLEGAHQRLVLVQLYPNFFNEFTTWCNSESLSIWAYAGRPRLTQELRNQLNELGDKVRQVIINAVQRHDSLNSPANEKWVIMDEHDTDIYPRYRFCEDFPRVLDHPNVLFFKFFSTDTTNSVEGRGVFPQYNATTCMDQSEYEDDFAFMLNCDMARYTAAVERDLGPGSIYPRRPYMPERLIKAFHPKTEAHRRIKNKHKEKIKAFFNSGIPHDELRTFPGGSNSPNSTENAR